MKIFKYLLVIAFLTGSTLFAADPVAKPQRIGEDPKIIGFASIKDPNSFVKKLVKTANAVYPGSGAMLEQYAAMVKPILDSSVAVTVVVYSNEKFTQPPVFGIYITVKDPKVLDNPMLANFPSKEIVENTLIITMDPNSMAKFKELKKNVVGITTQKDIEIHIDIKNIVKLNDEVITKDYPFIKDILKQIEMGTIKLDLINDGFEFSGSLITADKSNLQTMLVQPNADGSLLKYVGAGNFSSGIATFDLAKAKGFLQDLIKAANSVPGITEKDRTKLNEFSAVALAFCDNGIAQYASTMSYNESLTSKGLIKLKDPSLFIKLSKSSDALFKCESFNNAFGKTLQNDNYDFKLEEVEKYNGLQVYKIDTFSQKDKEILNQTNIPIPKNQYILVDNNYIYSATELPLLKSLVDTVKANPTAEVVLESTKFFKGTHSFYSDFYLVGFVKMVENLVGAFGVKVDGISSLKLPPYKFAVSLDGNANVKSFIETSTISALVQKGMEAMQQVAPGGDSGMGEGDKPKAQP